jgi:hypothetical protein
VSATSAFPERLFESVGLVQVTYYRRIGKDWEPVRRSLRYCARFPKSNVIEQKRSPRFSFLNFLEKTNLFDLSFYEKIIFLIKENTVWFVGGVEHQPLWEEVSRNFNKNNAGVAEAPTHHKISTHRD